MTFGSTYAIQAAKPVLKFLPDENFGRHSQVDKTAYTVDDKIRDSKK